jgi:hypothetical protein
VAEVFEEVSDLGRCDTQEGERREMVFVEELGFGGFMAVFGSATGDFGKEEKLVGMEGVGRMTMKIAVEDRSELGDANFVAGFLVRFAGGGDGGRFTDVSPATGKSPPAVFQFTDKQDAPVFEGGNASIHFWSGVAGLLGEELSNRGRIGKRGACSHHFCGDLPDLLIPMNIKLFLAIGEAGLGEGLKAARPGKPLRNRHESILAVREDGNKPANGSACGTNDPHA